MQITLVSDLHTATEGALAHATRARIGACLISERLFDWLLAVLERNLGEQLAWSALVSVPGS